MYKLWIGVFAVATVLLAGVMGNSFAQSPSELLAVERAHRAAFNAHDIDQVMTYCTEDVVMDYAVFGATPFVGKEQVATFFRAILQAFPDFNDTEQLALASSNIVVTECAVTETHQGAWGSIPATGRPVKGTHMAIFEFEGYMINKMTVYDDQAGFLVQVGAMPAPTLPLLVPSITLPEPVTTDLSPVELARFQHDVWNSHDLSRWAPILAMNGDYFFNTLGVPLDRSALVAVQELYMDAFPDIRSEITRILDLGEGWVLAEVGVSGTNTGPFFGVPATGRTSGPDRVAWIGRFVGGQMTYWHTYYDNLTTLANLGLVPGLGGTTSVHPSTWGRIKSTFR